MNLSIHVREEHIDRGERIYNWYLNPIALAMREVGFYHPFVHWGRGVICWDSGDTSYATSMPPHVKEWLQSFDNYKEVKPFSFELEVYERRVA